MRYSLALAAFTSLFLAGCIFDYHKERLAGPYSLVAVDTEDQLSVCYRVAKNICADRVGPTVVMAGANNRYIVASRRQYDEQKNRAVGEEQFFYIDRRVDGPSIDVKNKHTGALQPGRIRGAGCPTWISTDACSSRLSSCLGGCLPLRSVFSSRDKGARACRRSEHALARASLRPSRRRVGAHRSLGFRSRHPALSRGQPLPKSWSPRTVPTLIGLSRRFDLCRHPRLARITRFETAVCPVAIGLPQAQAAVVQARIREIAKQAGLAEAKVGCDPNLVVAIAEDGQAFVRELRRRHPGLFSDLSLHEWERLEAWPGPAWSWRMTRAARRDGVP